MLPALRQPCGTHRCSTRGKSKEDWFGPSPHTTLGGGGKKKAPDLTIADRGLVAQLLKLQRLAFD